jgi:hypothetical protein
MDLTLEHIDPRDHELICGLKNHHNEIIADASYNYSKANLFLPYRCRDHPQPVNKGDLCEFLIQGEWQVTEFLGDWWWHEANKFSRARSFGRIGSSTQLWENRIQEIEHRLGVHIIVCSLDGELRKAHLCRRRCSHTLSKVYQLWVTCNSKSFCCQLEACRENNRIRTIRKALKRALHRSISSIN